MLGYVSLFMHGAGTCNYGIFFIDGKQYKTKIYPKEVYIKLGWNEKRDPPVEVNYELDDNGWIKTIIPIDLNITRRINLYGVERKC